MAAHMHPERELGPNRGRLPKLAAGKLVKNLSFCARSEERSPALAPGPLYEKATRRQRTRSLGQKPFTTLFVSLSIMTLYQIILSRPDPGRPPPPHPKCVDTSR